MRVHDRSPVWRRDDRVGPLQQHHTSGLFGRTAGRFDLVDAGILRVSEKAVKLSRMWRDDVIRPEALEQSVV